MEKLPENKVLKYKPDTLVFVRRLYNLDKPGQMSDAVDLLQAWISKQHHFVKKDYSREYLERVIILLKGSVERAKAQIDKICTLRTLLPHFFEKIDAKKDFEDLKGVYAATLLPQLTEDHNRIYITRINPFQYSSKMFLNIFFYNVLLFDYMKAHDYCDGIITIIDLRDVKIIDFVSNINVMDLKRVATIVLEGYDTRVKNFLFISNSKTIDVFIKLFKQVISEKLGKRVHVLKDIEELCSYVSKELLPSDYGGNEKSLDQLSLKFKEELGSPENIKYFKEISKARTIESMRITSTYSGDFSGIEGTFRTLTVD